MYILWRDVPLISLIYKGTTYLNKFQCTPWNIPEILDPPVYEGNLSISSIFVFWGTWDVPGVSLFTEFFYTPGGAWFLPSSVLLILLYIRLEFLFEPLFFTRIRFTSTKKHGWPTYPSRPRTTPQKYALNEAICATKKTLLTFHYTGCLIGILILAYYNPYITG